ncbi:TRAP transporter substrate-binding protein [Petroclostridium sp. X23]|uniref:TRAP transporter substrate-binding protein n=1 Tax=Petroclostridium sp. X23 TaxID=3045146 RepID=UPI0024ADAAE6|nr:TRAP transporter substrate-binding protein [Petroclostridium sp. X23]WHH57330.1 TRAP transporter substrate-binding protein [Petroclostridium sp. X23]
MRKGLAVVSMLLVFVMLFAVGCTPVGKEPAPAKEEPAKQEPAAQEPAKKEENKDAEIVLKLGYGAPTSNPRHLVAEQYSKWVSEQTNGKVKIELYPAEMLGTDKQMAEAVTMGTLDMSINAHGVIASYEPKLAAIELPFLFDAPEKVGKVLDGEIGEELAKNLPAKGMRILAYWENGLRHITNSKKAIEKPEDLKGLKIRTPENKMTLAIFKALGASPAPLAFPELYLALSQGVFDGQENPVTNIHAAKFDEVQKYISITNHKYESCPLIVSETVWGKLPADVQKVLKEGAVKFAQEHRKMIQENEAKLLADLESKGMKVSRPDLKPFQEATKSVYAEWESVLGKDLIEKIQAAAK